MYETMVVFHTSLMPRLHPLAAEGRPVHGLSARLALHLTRKRKYCDNYAEHIANML